ncbi:MAG: adenylate/guanylate cyclase domain-containing protein [gamma proteobacterium symbiont of Bathyaustriella thionipta]|nr:adenylate/guanylate cyclase domain-containing protein [gamma proteobacterium symbiont of Bathyaustriella thionipta]
MKLQYRYLPEDIAQQIIADTQVAQLGGRDIEGSVLFCDVVGFTGLSETLEPAVIVNLLNEYFHFIVLAGKSCRGIVDKYIGDCVMMVFGVSQADKQHALHAVTCGLLIQLLVEHVNKNRQRQSLATIEFRIGINSGAMLAGNVGAADRMEYTVLGDTVNLASRLGGLAEPGTVTASEATWKQAGAAEQVLAQQQSSVRVKGRNQPVNCYKITGLYAQHAEALQQMLDALIACHVRDDDCDQNKTYT